MALGLHTAAALGSVTGIDADYFILTGCRLRAVEHSLATVDLRHGSVLPVHIQAHLTCTLGSRC